MTAKDICLEFLTRIREKKLTQKKFCDDNNLNYSAFRTMLDKVIKYDKDVRLGTLIPYADALGYELTLTPKKSKVKKKVG